MKTAGELLSEFGIQLKTYRHGNQKSRCPKCSHLRKKQRDPCLSVEIGNDGIRFNCFNCGHHGGAFYDSLRVGLPPPRRFNLRPKPSARDVQRLYR